MNTSELAKKIASRARSRAVFASRREGGALERRIESARRAARARAGRALSSLDFRGVSQGASRWSLTGHSGRVGLESTIVDVRSLGFRTDLMVRRLAGAEITDHGTHLVVRTPHNPGFYWGNFLLLAEPPAEGELAGGAAFLAQEFPDADHVAIGIDSRAAVSVSTEELAQVGLRMEISTVMSTGADSLIRPDRPKVAARCRELAGEEDWRQATALRLHIAHEDGNDSDAHTEFVVFNM